MKYVKILGLLAVAAGAFMAFAGAASASIATSPPGTPYTGTIHAESVGHVVLHSENAPTPFTVECEGTVHGHITRHGSMVEPPTTTKVGGPITSITWKNCTNGVTVVVSKTGELEAEATGGGNGKVTSTGAEVTVHVPLGFKCIYTTTNTPIGELTGGAPAELDINSSTITRTGGSAFCGTGGFWTGKYKITTPANFRLS